MPLAPLPPEPAPPAAEEVVVRAARLPDPTGEAAVSVTHVDPAALAEATTLDDALKTAPGFSLYRRTSTLGANPTTQGASLRAIAGSGASRALVTLDGVPQNDPFGGWVIWSALPSETVGAARIVRGAGSGPYGAGALTGVVQLDSREAGDGVSGSASVGNLGYRQETLEGGAGGGDARAGLRLRPGERRLDPRARGPRGRRPPAGPARLGRRRPGGARRGRRRAGRARLGLRGGPRGGLRRLRLARLGPAAGRDADRAAHRRPRGLSPAGLGLGVRPVQLHRRQLQRAQHLHPVQRAGGHARARLGRERGVAAAPGPGEPGGGGRRARGDGRDARVTSYSAAAAAFTRTRKAGGQTLVAGAYVEASDRVGPWLLVAGARVDRWSDTGGERVERVVATGVTALDDRPADQAGVEPTARLGARRDLSDLGAAGLALRTAAYAGFRPATLNELHRPFRVGNNLTESNPGLVPERLYGAEVGLDYTRGPLTAAATVFRNRLEDAVLNVTVGAGPATFPIAGFVPAGGVLRQRQNAGSVDATGLEADGDLRLMADRLHLSTGLAYTYASVDATRLDPQLEGKRPALTPRLTATAEARVKPTPRLEAAADLRYESARFDDDLNTLRLRPALTVDLRAEWALRPGLALYVAADNVLDAAIRTAETADHVYSYDAPRLVRVGVRLRR